MQCDLGVLTVRLRILYHKVRAASLEYQMDPGLLYNRLMGNFQQLAGSSHR
jgi:hypothetical protein